MEELIAPSPLREELIAEQQLILPEPLLKEQIHTSNVMSVQSGLITFDLCM